MNHCYRDILDRIHEPPRWFDEEAVPRYCRFAPSEIANIYASECALLVIECQNCRRPFDVAMSWHRLDERGSLSDRVRNQTIHYGDPPNVECCDSGLAMNSVPVRVLEFWENQRGHDWVRVPLLEAEVRADWDDTPRDEPEKVVTQPLLADRKARKVQVTLDLDDEEAP